MSENEAQGTSPETSSSGVRPDEAALAALPDKLRVHALARLLGSSSREVLALLARLGVAARSAQSSVDRETVSRVVEDLFPSSPPAAPTLPEPEPDLAAAEPARPAEPVVTGAISNAPSAPAALFLAPDVATPAVPADDEEPAAGGRRRRRSSRSTGVVTPSTEVEPTPEEAAPEASAPETTADDTSGPDTDGQDDGDDDSGRRRRRRGRRGRGRGRGGDEADDNAEGDESTDESDDSSEEGTSSESDDSDDESDDSSSEDESGSSDSGSSRRRRRRRRRSDDSGEPTDDPPNTVTHVREKAEKAEKSDKGASEKSDRRSSDDEVRGVKGSTRLEAKRQRRRDGREQGRRRPSILSESEFLARREAVERTMVVRQQADRSQIGVLEDGVLVEHFVAGIGANSMVGNVYLGRVQNVLPSMEAAFVDIGRGRNAVLYAGEVNWDAAGLDGKQRKIEHALSSGDSVLVQVTKDPVGHKGARLTTQISLPGRFLVYVPGGGATGISRKLPEPERKRLKEILKRIVPDEAGVIIRTAAEGIEEDELEADVRRLAAQWEVIERTGQDADAKKGKAPTLVHEEPDLLIRVVRDMFNEDFSSLVISGEQAWETLEGYISHVAPELVGRLSRHTGPEDVFAAYRIDEQLVKALDRKVWLPSGGTLVIDRTEAMTVVDVNTGKFTGSGGNLEETVTRNNLEAAEEVVRQLRLRDIGGMIVIDFIDMVLESNRDLVLRRLTECLGRDRTRHQVAEVTSLGLVQMTRKRVGQGLLDEFSTPCEHCKGRGVIVSDEPVAVGSAAQSNDQGSKGPNGSGDRNGSNGAAAPSGSNGASSESNGNGSSGSGRRRGRGRRGASSEGGSPTTVVDAVVGSAPVPSPAELASRRATNDDAVEESEVALEETLAEESTGTPDDATPVTVPDDTATSVDTATTGDVAPVAAEEPEVALEETLAEESTGTPDDAAPVAVEEPEVALEETLAEESTGTPEPDRKVSAAEPLADAPEPTADEIVEAPVAPTSEEPDQPVVTGRIGSIHTATGPEQVEEEPEEATPAVPAPAEPAARRRRRAASRPGGPPVGVAGS
ncbi:translation initiation factor IF-2 N-terminal domain-containing protein [Actinomycetospora atypica]|uniref:Translation initiation factor IF-2 N-terminal domain-containing protein n=1 Tax=Actinomycetospora atypica TaxID=1290095 RepID=A0ABV9YH08_9PSEU